MNKLNLMMAFAMALLVLVPSSLFASSHREAPITALDRTADIGTPLSATITLTGSP